MQNCQVLEEDAKFCLLFSKLVGNALAIGHCTGSTLWADAIVKEIKNVLVAFDTLEDCRNVPHGSSLSNVTCFWHQDVVAWWKMTFSCNVYLHKRCNAWDCLHCRDPGSPELAGYDGCYHFQCIYTSFMEGNDILTTLSFKFGKMERGHHCKSPVWHEVCWSCL